MSWYSSKLTNNQVAAGGQLRLQQLFEEFLECRHQLSALRGIPVRQISERVARAPQCVPKSQRWKLALARCDRHALCRLPHCHRDVQPD